MSMAVGLGVSVGTVIGVFTDDIGIGIAMGIPIGAGIGLTFGIVYATMMQKPPATICPKCGCSTRGSRTRFAPRAARCVRQLLMHVTDRSDPSIRLLLFSADRHGDRPGGFRRRSQRNASWRETSSQAFVLLDTPMPSATASRALFQDETRWSRARVEPGFMHVHPLQSVRHVGSVAEEDSAESGGGRLFPGPLVLFVCSDEVVAQVMEQAGVANRNLQAGARRVCIANVVHERVTLQQTAGGVDESQRNVEHIIEPRERLIRGRLLAADPLLEEAVQVNDLLLPGVLHEPHHTSARSSRTSESGFGAEADVDQYSSPSPDSSVGCVGPSSPP